MSYVQDGCSPLFTAEWNQCLKTVFRDLYPSSTAIKSDMKQWQGGINQLSGCLDLDGVLFLLSVAEGAKEP